MGSLRPLLCFSQRIEIFLRQQLEKVPVKVNSRFFLVD